MVFESGMIGLGTMGAYLYGLRRSADPALASTLAFNTLTLSELTHSWSARSEHRVLFGGGQHLTPNPHLKRTILAMGGLQAAVSLLPPFRRLLGTAPMGLVDLAVVAGGVLLPLMVNEATKPAAPPEMEDGGNRDGTEQGAMG
jgi:P-type Ca2+ transporter type 2C